MTILGLCFDGTAHGVALHQDRLLVVVSYIVAVFASYTALEMVERLRGSSGVARGLWRIAAAVVLGGGVWSMHFVGILAMKIPLSVGYAPVLTLVSGLVAIGAVAVGLLIIGRTAELTRIAAAGLLVGLGIATMHYAGMAALRLPGQIYYKPGLFALSIVLAVGAATAALWLASALRRGWQRGLAALVMAMAVCGMHYTGMAATEIVAGSARLGLAGDAIPAGVLAVGVVGGVTALFCLGLVWALVDRHLEQRRAEQRLREAIDVMPAALAFYDVEDRLVAWNAAYANIFENDAALRPGIRFVDLLRAPLGEAELAALLTVRRELGVVERQVPDGRWMRFESRRTTDGGIVSIGTDISVLKGQAESLAASRDAAEAANAAKSAFLNTMGHELRTPLNGVLGMVQALGGDALTEVQNRRVDVIRQSSETLLAILGNLLDLTQAETGAGATSHADVEFDLDELLRGAVGAHRLAAEAKGLTFSYDLAEEARGGRVGNAEGLRRIVHNLLDNAVKFTESGAVTLRVNASDGLTWFEVSDTGAGIAEGDMDRLFEPFFQADESLTRRHGGAGIGLAVSRRLADRVGGRIGATSRAGQGSVFTLELPLVRLDPEPAAAQSGGPREALDEPLRVLAAEDNPVNQVVLRALLGAVGIEPVLVADGEEAVAAWCAHAWDVVLMDIQMPRMNGVEATRAIRTIEAKEGRSRTPIVAVTANAMAHQARDYIAAGMDGVVAKPVELAALIAAIDTAFEATAAEVA